MRRKIFCGQVPGGLLLLFLVLSVPFFPGSGCCETLGIKDTDGNFVPKVSVSIDKKEIVIKKINARDRYRSVSLKINPSNRALMKSTALLNVEWVGPDNHVGKPVPFAGPQYDRTNNVFQEPMMKSVALRITDKSGLNLFAGKGLSDLFLVRIDNAPLTSAESAGERDRTVQMGKGRDVSLNVDKTSVVFNEGNLKRGEMINIDNRSGLDQMIGIELPQKGFFLCQVRRKLEQTKIPKEDWERFTLAADQGIFLALIPDSDPAQLAQLDGREVVIRTYHGNEVRETRRLPIEISSDLRHMSGDPSAGVEAAAGRERPPTTKSGPKPRPDDTVVSPQPRPNDQSRERLEANRRPSNGGSFWLWVLQVTNLVLLVGMWFYGLFYVLPKVQVLQDRVSKSEMFIHGSREAIREELDQIKREMMEQSHRDAAEK